MKEMSAEAARAFFPRGLFQPEGSFRFSLDALLLSCFLVPEKNARLLDLGTGCGVVALAMLCRCPDLAAVGLEIQPELVEAAKVNATRLGFSGRFTVIHGDAAAPELPGRVRGTCDLVLANPPYRQRHRGRLPAGRLRLTALFEEEGGLPAFCAAAARALREKGRFGVIFPTARRDELLSALAAAGLKTVRLLPVQARETDPPRLLLTEAVKTAPEGQTPPEDPPLTLYSGRGGQTTLTEQALAFCPFLARGL